MAKIGDVGTLRELDVKPGDRVMMVDVHEEWDGTTFTIQDDMRILSDVYSPQYWGHVTDDFCVGIWKLISRATPQPKLWRDMTPEEKGTILLAAHEGKVIEVFGAYCDWTGKTLKKWQQCSPLWVDTMAYRVKPEPVRETVVFDDKEYSFKIMKGHRITFDTIDGVPDCNSVKMEAI